MVLSRREIAIKAGRKSAENARRRRFQRYVAEMRESGLVIEVQTTEFHGPIVHPDYTVDAVRKALGR